MADTVDVGGRPLKFSTPQELQIKVDEYFSGCDRTILRQKYDKEGNITETIYRPYTITGLAVALGVERETILTYGERDGFSDIIKEAKRKCQNTYEENALTGAYNPAFAIFAVKNHFGWKDKTEVEQSNTHIIINNTTSDEELKQLASGIL